MSENDSNIHKLESIRENYMPKILWDFEIQSDHPIPTRKPNLMLINKKKRICDRVHFAVLADHRVKNKLKN